MTPLRALPVAVVDTETTSLHTDKASIIDIGVIHTTLGGTDDPRIALSSLVKPSQPVPEESTRIHGITDADVAGAPTWAELVGQVAEACAGRLVVAFNAPYDFQVMRNENARVGAAAPDWPWLDLLVVRKATKTRGRPGRLTEIAVEYGIDLDAHGACGDALVTALLLTPLMRSAWAARAFASAAGAPRQRQNDKRELRVDTLEALLEWQGAAALYQEQDFARYCQGKGDVFPPSSPWHVLAGLTPPSWAVPSKATALSCSRCGITLVRRVEKDGSQTINDLRGGPHQCPNGAP